MSLEQGALNLEDEATLSLSPGGTAVGQNEKSEHPHYEGLQTLELNRHHSCTGTYHDREGAARKANFEYSSRDTNASEFSLTSEQQAYLQEVLSKDNFHFEVYSRTGQATVGELDNRTVYFLMHGHSGETTVFNGVRGEGNMSEVEKIMALDENAVVVCADYLGFGKSQANGGEVSVSQYVKEFDFLATNILKIEPKSSRLAIETGKDGLPYQTKRMETAADNIKVEGHSTGGATVWELAMMYDCKGVALAPAFYVEGAEKYLSYFEQPTPKFLSERLALAHQELAAASAEESRTHAQASIEAYQTAIRIFESFSQQSEEFDKLYDSQRKFISTKYRALAGLVSIGVFADKIAPQAVRDAVNDKVVDVVVEMIGPDMVGPKITQGEDSIDIQQDLVEIHKGQHRSEKRTAVVELWNSLNAGISIDNVTTTEILRLATNVETFSASDDGLVPKEVIFGSLRAVEAKAFGILEQAGAISAEADAALFAILQMNEAYKRATNPDHIIDGGHYATIYGSEDDKPDRTLVKETA